MKMAKRALALVLALSMAVFAGCSGSKDTSWVVKNGEKTVAPGTYIYFMINAYGAAVGMVPDISADILTQEVEGVPASNWIKDESLKNAKRMLAVDAKYDEMGLTLTEEELGQIDAYTQAQMESYKEFMDANGVGEESLKAFYTNNYKTNSIFFKLYDEGGEKAVPDEEIRAFFDENYTNSNYLICPKFDPETYNNLDEAGLAAAKAEAEGYYNRALAGEDFNDILADWEKANYSEEEMAAHEHEAAGSHDMVISRYTTQVPAEFLRQVNQAEIGKPVLFEDDFYYYVLVRRDLTGTVADATLANARASILMELRSQEYVEMCDQWVSEMEIEVNEEALKRYTPEKLNMEALMGGGSSSEQSAGSLSVSAVEESAEPSSEEAGSSDGSSAEGSSSQAE